MSISSYPQGLAAVWLLRERDVARFFPGDDAMLSTALLTGLSLFAACVSGVALWAAVRTFDKAEGMVRSLERDLRALAVMRLDVDALDTRVRRLAGSVYSPPGSRRKPAAPSTLNGDDDPHVDLDELDPQLAAELALQKAPPVAPGRT
jgi:hypothetical protein